MVNQTPSPELLTLTADIVAAHVTNNAVAVGDLPALIGSVHTALVGLGTAVPPVAVEQTPAVSIRASIKPDYLVCIEDGKKLKMLKRHLMTHYQMTPADYRAKWKLPADYPMVAPNYAELRRALAHKIGLGRKPAVRAAKPAAKPQAETQAKAATKAAAKPKIAPAKKAAAPRKKLSVATPA